MDWLVRLSTGKAETETEIETAVADGYADGDAQRWSIELDGGYCWLLEGWRVWRVVMIEEWKSQSLNKEIECHATQRKKRLHNYSHHEAEFRSQGRPRTKRQMF